MTTDGIMFLSGLLGLGGSALLALPAIRGLPDRKKIDRARRLFETTKAAALQKKSAATTQEAKDQADSEIEGAYAAYQMDRDGTMADALGKHWANSWMNIGGAALLFVAFGLAMVASVVG